MSADAQDPGVRCTTMPSAAGKQQEAVRLRALNLHNAHAAGALDREPRMVAEPRDVNPSGVSGLKMVEPSVYCRLDAIDGNSYVGHSRSSPVFHTHAASACLACGRRGYKSARGFAWPGGRWTVEVGRGMGASNVPMTL